MKRAFKTVLLWLLIAALPLHAVAGAVGMSCSHGHGQRMEHAAQGGHAASGSHHHHEAVDAGTPQAHAKAKASDTGTLKAHATCSLCSPFCAGAVAPPSVSVSIPTFSGADATVIAPAPWFGGFIPEGLLRPPRTLSA